MTCGPGALRAPARTTDQTEPTMTAKTTKLEAAQTAHDAAVKATEAVSAEWERVARAVKIVREGGLLNEYNEDVLVDAARRTVGSAAYGLERAALVEIAGKSVVEAYRIAKRAEWEASKVLDADVMAAARAERRREARKAA